MKLEMKALALCYEVFGENMRKHDVTFNVSQNIVFALSDKKNYKKAMKLQLKILSQQNEVHAKPHPNIIIAMAHIARNKRDLHSHCSKYK